MSQAHAHAVYRHGHSRVHRLPAHVKIVAVLVFATTVVATPRERLWAFAAYAVVVAAAMTAARLPPAHVLPRLAIELPFVAFALALPFVVAGPGIEVFGIGLSRTGLWDAWNVLAKATLGVAASLVLASTTSGRQLLVGVQRLRVPSPLVQILMFMLGYLSVTASEFDRMRTAQISRGFEARRPRHWRILAQSASALFVRSFERGERVHLAMLSRGYTGRLPLRTAPAGVTTWAYGLVLPAAAVLVALSSWAWSW